MQIFFFSAVETLIIDVIVWSCFHLGIGFWASQIPVEKFDPDHWFFQTFDWEKGGQIYQDLFRVRSWKRFIPQGSKLYPNTFSLQKLKSLDPEYLELWLNEVEKKGICRGRIVPVPVLFSLL